MSIPERLGPGPRALAGAAQLDGNVFGRLFHSPLSRAARTAEIIWGSRSGPVSVLPSLREVDLYSFQVPPTARAQRAAPLCCTPVPASPGAVLGERLLLRRSQATFGVSEHALPALRKLT
jgi:hypothetical protein